MAAPVAEVEVTSEDGAPFELVDLLMFVLFVQRTRFTRDVGIWATTDNEGRVTGLVARGETKEEQHGAGIE